MQERKHYGLEDIRSVTARKRLQPQKEPYWAKLATGRHLGVFKTAPLGQDGGRWIARWTEPSDSATGSRPKYFRGTLGDITTEQDYDWAKVAAEKFFVRAERDWKNQQHGGAPMDELRTVQDAVRQYVTNLRSQKGADPADRAAGLFKSTIDGTHFGRIPLDDLHAGQVNQWLRGLVKDGTRKGRTANRIFRQFKAAMNFTKRLGRIDSDNPWTNVEPFTDSDGRRNAYLRPEQIAAILASCERPKDAREELANPDFQYCTPDLANLMRACLITGARPGELAKAKVKDFDAITGTLTLVSSKNKKGAAKPREFYLTDTKELKFFTTMAKDKVGDVHLLTRVDGSSWVYSGGKMDGIPRRREWSAGLRAAVADANKHLQKELRIPVPSEQSGRTTMYTARHTAITQMLDSGVEMFAVTDSVGTSPRMLKEHYDQNRKKRVREELAKRKSQ
jgi:integrase